MSECKDYICTMHFEFEETCKVYEKAEGDINCHIPCELQNCTVNYLSFVDCELWKCDKKLTPIEPAIMVSHTLVITLSVFFVLLFIVGASLGTYVFILRRRIQYQRIESPTPSNDGDMERNDGHGSIIRGAENSLQNAILGGPHGPDVISDQPLPSAPGFDIVHFRDEVEAAESLNLQGRIARWFRRRRPQEN
jgi:hypothetical protein